MGGGWGLDLGLSISPARHALQPTGMVGYFVWKSPSSPNRPRGYTRCERNAGASPISSVPSVSRWGHACVIVMKSWSSTNPPLDTRPNRR